MKLLPSNIKSGRVKLPLSCMRSKSGRVKLPPSGTRCRSGHVKLPRETQQPSATRSRNGHAKLLPRGTSKMHGRLPRGVHVYGDDDQATNDGNDDVPMKVSLACHVLAGNRWRP